MDIKDNGETTTTKKKPVVSWSSIKRVSIRDHETAEAINSQQNCFKEAEDFPIGWKGDGDRLVGPQNYLHKGQDAHRTLIYRTIELIISQFADFRLAQMTNRNSTLYS